MYGVVNESPVYPIIDLIRRELRRFLLKHGRDGQETPFEDIPTVRLFREHPQSDSVITRVELSYEAPYIIKIFLGYGGMGSPFILDNILAIGYVNINNWTSEEVIRYQMFLNRDEKGVLTGVDVITRHIDEETP